MTTEDLAKEFDSLARTLRALSYAASQEFATALDLERRHAFYQKRPHSFSPAPLTIGAVKAALGDTIGKGANRVIQLRKDVYERREEKLRHQHAKELADAARAGRPAPEGTPIGTRPKRTPTDPAWYADHLGFFDRSALGADVHAWAGAGLGALAQLLPIYWNNEIERFVAKAMPEADVVRVQWKVAERIREARDRWIDTHLVLRAKIDASGRLVAIVGADPTPFADALKAFQAGNLDPLGILKTA